MKESSLAICLPAIREDIRQHEQHLSRLESIRQKEERAPWYTDLSQITHAIEEEQAALDVLHEKESAALGLIHSIPDARERAAFGLTHADEIPLGIVAKTLEVTEEEAARLWLRAYNRMVEKEK